MSESETNGSQINMKYLLLFTVVVVVGAIIYHSYNSENFKSRNYNCCYDCDCGCNDYNCNNYDDYGCYDYNCNNYGCEEYFGGVGAGQRELSAEHFGTAAVSSLGAEYFGGVGAGQRELSAEHFGTAAVSSLGAEHFGGVGAGQRELSAEHFGTAAVSSLGAEHFGKRRIGLRKLSLTGIDIKGIGCNIKKNNKHKVIEGFLIR